MRANEVLKMFKNEKDMTSVISRVDVSGESDAKRAKVTDKAVVKKTKRIVQYVCLARVELITMVETTNTHANM